MAVDGTVFDVPDSEENAAYFGRPKTHRTERCAFPQVRVVALAECGAHAITAAALGPRTVPGPASHSVVTDRERWTSLPYGE